MAQRSTKGASKQRRDAINERVLQIRELLPVSEAARSRLSQLQVMALACSYISKSNILNQAVGMLDDRTTTWCDNFDFLQAVPGFLMIFGSDAKILYISDNVCDYLGNSAVDIITQTETLYELIDERDYNVISEALSPETPDSAASGTSSVGLGIVSFVCRMNTAARSVRYAPAPIKTGFERFRTMQVHGRRLAMSEITHTLTGYPGASPSTSSRLWRSAVPSDYAYAVVCTPSLSAADVLSISLLDGGAVAWDTTVFRSQHDVNMKFITVDPNGEYQLGYDRGTIYGKSWYEMVHPDDQAEATFKHMDLMHSVELSAWRSLCIRVQTGRADIIWLHVVMRVCDVTNDGITSRRIVCINQVIDDDEARVIRANAAAIHDDVDIGLLRGPQRFLDGLFDDGAHPSMAGTKRGVTSDDDWLTGCSPMKMSRQMDDVSTFMSMPSPPLNLHSGGNLTDLSVAGSDWQTDCGILPLPCYSTVEGEFLTTKSESAPPPYIPDSFLTPNASPCSFTTQSPAPYQHSSREISADLGVPLHAEDMSFFDHQVAAVPVKPHGVIINDLPELDLPTVTSYLDCLEQCEPVPGLNAPARLQQGPGHASLTYSRAPVPLTVEISAGGVVHEKLTTLDDELLQNLFSTASTFLSSVNTAVKPFDFGGFNGGDLLSVSAQC